MKCNKHNKFFFIVNVSFFLSSVFFFGCSSKTDAYNSGFNNGFEKGITQAKIDCENKLKKQEQLNKEKLEEKKKEYENLVIETYNKAYEKGKADMEFDLNQTIIFNE